MATEPPADIGVDGLRLVLPSQKGQQSANYCNLSRTREFVLVALPSSAMGNVPWSRRRSMGAGKEALAVQELVAGDCAGGGDGDSTERCSFCKGV